MRRATLLTFVVLSPLLVAACGDDDPDVDLPPTSRTEVFRSNLAAQCEDIKQKQEALPTPVEGTSAELAAYLGKVSELERDLRVRLRAFDPPAEIEPGLRKALAEEKKLGDTIRSYERAAGGGRPFEVVLGQLERALNPQIRRANAAFRAIDIPGCQGDELDLGYG